MRRPELDHILNTMLNSQPEVSDLLFTVDKPLQVEALGELKPVTCDPPIEKLTPFQTEMIALNLMGENQWHIMDLLRRGSCDTAYTLTDKARFRISIFSQRGSYSIVLRKLNTVIPTLEWLNFPDIIRQIPREKTGLVLVTGATGSGKSTTLAAVLNEINQTKPVHIITLEDPVEFIHTHDQATFNQRELGTDFDSFSNGLRAALRQAPKVILVGEMRDRETVRIALSAAETGHLVLSTIHTIDAGQTINRILGMFETDEQEQIRARMAELFAQLDDGPIRCAALVSHGAPIRALLEYTTNDRIDLKPHAYDYGNCAPHAGVWHGRRGDHCWVWELVFRPSALEG